MRLRRHEDVSKRTQVGPQVGVSEADVPRHRKPIEHQRLCVLHNGREDEHERGHANACFEERIKGVVAARGEQAQSRLTVVDHVKAPEEGHFVPYEVREPENEVADCDSEEEHDWHRKIARRVQNKVTRVFAQPGGHRAHQQCDRHCHHGKLDQQVEGIEDHRGREPSLLGARREDVLESHQNNDEKDRTDRQHETQAGGQSSCDFRAHIYRARKGDCCCTGRQESNEESGVRQSMPHRHVFAPVARAALSALLRSMVANEQHAAHETNDP